MLDQDQHKPIITGAVALAGKQGVLQAAADKRTLFAFDSISEVYIPQLKSREGGVSLADV